MENRKGDTNMTRRKRTKQSAVKRWKLEHIAVLIVLGLLLAVALWAELSAASWRVPVRWGEPTDSTRLLFYKDGVQANTAKRINSQSYDTTFIINNDTFYTVEFRIYYAGVDSAANWVWERFIGFVGASGGDCAGDGSESVRIFAVDTSGTDVALQDVKITIRNAAGEVIAVLPTGSNGSATFFLNQASG
jgi:hypothetical protein